MPGQGHNLQLEENVPKRLRSDGHGRDIFALVKLAMSDSELCQPPLLVLPHSFLRSTEEFFNKVNNDDCPMLRATLEDSRCSELNELAAQLASDYPHLARGVRYLQSLTQPDRPRTPCSKLQFVQVGPRGRALDVGNLRLNRQPPEPKPYKLQVVFHHRVRWFDLVFKKMDGSILSWQYGSISIHVSKPTWIGVGWKKTRHYPDVWSCLVTLGAPRKSKCLDMATWCKFEFLLVHIMCVWLQGPCFRAASVDFLGSCPAMTHFSDDPRCNDILQKIRNVFDEVAPLTTALWLYGNNINNPCVCPKMFGTN